MADRIVTIFGASGFVGRHTVRALARRGWRIRAAVRHPNLAVFLKPMGDVGQIQPLRADVTDDDAVARAVEGASAVINLVGILYERGAQTFDAVQAEAPGRIAAAAKAAGVDRFVQVSAIGADSKSVAGYGRSKATGERYVLDEFPQAVVVRPSIVFGPEDDFFNRFAGLARILPALPLINGGTTRFQPVYVCDVAEAISAALTREDVQGRIYELGGPGIYSFEALLQFILEAIDRRRLLVPIPFSVARVQASVLQYLPKPLLTPDQVEMLKSDNVVSEEAEREGLTLAGLGIDASAIDAIVPAYLKRFRRSGQFQTDAGV